MKRAEEVDGDEEGVDSDPFPFDTSILDDYVTEILEADTDSEDLSIDVEYGDVVPVEDHDWEELEQTLNGASIVTSVGGAYLLEEDGEGFFKVTFAADPDETEALVEEFSTPAISENGKDD